MIITKFIKIKIGGGNIKHFKNLGYKIKRLDIITIPIEHLQKGSHQKIKVKCDVCNIEKEIEHRLYLKNTKNYTIEYSCSQKCAYNIGKNQKTCLKKYGVEFTSQIKEHKELVIETWNNKSEKELEEINNKRNNTKKELYGDKYYNNMDKNKQTKLKNHGDENYNNRNKFIKTCLKKYGVENVFQVEEIKEISNQTILNTYGVKHVMHSDKIKNKAFETRYGITHEKFIERLSDFLKYRKKILKITNQQLLFLLKNYNKRGNTKIKGSYHIDHKFSIFEGFVQNISPHIIGNIVNLEMLTWEDNCSKHTKCSLTKKELFNLYDNKNKILKQLEKEYKK